MLKGSLPYRHLIFKPKSLNPNSNMQPLLCKGFRFHNTTLHHAASLRLANVHPLLIRSSPPRAKNRSIQGTKIGS
jgi:hypothetical protein